MRRQSSSGLNTTPIASQHQSALMRTANLIGIAPPPQRKLEWDPNRADAPMRRRGSLTLALALTLALPLALALALALTLTPDPNQAANGRPINFERTLANERRRHPPPPYRAGAPLLSGAALRDMLDAHLGSRDFRALVQRALPDEPTKCVLH